MGRLFNRRPDLETETRHRPCHLDLGIAEPVLNAAVGVTVSRFTRRRA